MHRVSLPKSLYGLETMVPASDKNKEVVEFETHRCRNGKRGGLEYCCMFTEANLKVSPKTRQKPIPRRSRQNCESSVRCVGGSSKAEECVCVCPPSSQF
ncbi:hypothetical protein BaRGS_00026363 [Batillaria attramentaria]|uniref:Uncharacterized protein n=1 Tax=Batillaria attramentaria TaxID=370345 RepID=A0ABD0K652_9CAEN